MKYRKMATYLIMSYSMASEILVAKTMMSKDQVFEMDFASVADLFIIATTLLVRKKKKLLLQLATCSD